MEKYDLIIVGAGPAGIFTAVELLAERGLAPVIICESAGTQAEDAKTMKRFFEACLCTTSQSGLRPPAPLVGEPLAKPFTLRGMPRPPLVRSNNDDRRQWRKQGVAVGAAASKTQAKRCGCWVPQPGQWHCEAMTERLFLFFAKTPCKLSRDAV